MEILASTSGLQRSSLERRLFYFLAVLALIYAFLAGLRTVGDFDTGWQMATGRWVVRHHSVPSVDVLSYTAQGRHWIYPVGAGVAFYLLFLAGGYTLLSWTSAAACAGTVALLLRRGSAASAGIAILAVPLIADRTPPRADMFSVIFFAAFLSILWQYYQTSRSPLWLLPIIMVFWVNVHFGFAAGLGLIAAYIAAEMLEMICGEAPRRAAVQRVRGAWIWLAATVLATLVNAWGWGIYRALLLQGRATAEQQQWIGEWRGVRLNWPTASAALTTGGAKSAFFLVLAVAVLAGAIALFRGQLGAAIMLFGASYAPLQHFRMEAVFACVVVVIAGPILSDALMRCSSWISAPRLRWVLTGATGVLFTVLVCARSADLMTNRFYFGGATQLSTFGMGLSWWFPRRAAEFIEREHLPGEIFNTYEDGGYLSWKLGPQRLDYIDGRDTLFGLPWIQLQYSLLKSPPDSPLWEAGIFRYGINTILLSYSASPGALALANFCFSNLWRLVYLDEVSAVFVRRTPETEPLIHRFPLNCATTPLPASTHFRNRAEEFVAWVNAAAVFHLLGRDSEALSASEKALRLFPAGAGVHITRAGALVGLDRRPEAEKELLRAVALAPGGYTWSVLADFYRAEGRADDAIAATRKGADLDVDPSLQLLQLGYYALSVGSPEDALQAFDEAERTAPGARKKDTGGNSFSYKMAAGRAEAWRRLGDNHRAAQAQEQAVQLAPNERQPWLNLAQIYELLGRPAEADRAKAHAASLANSPSP